MAEVVSDRFVVGNKWSKLKAPSPEWGPLFGGMLSPMDDVVVDRGLWCKNASIDLEGIKLADVDKRALIPPKLSPDS